MSADDPIVRQLAHARMRRGMSLAAVARLTGVAKSTVWMWEHGTRDPTLDNLRQWAYVFGFDVMLTATSTATTTRRYITTTESRPRST